MYCEIIVWHDLGSFRALVGIVLELLGSVAKEFGQGLVGCCHRLRAGLQAGVWVGIEVGWIMVWILGWFWAF